jgi:hypothetical protein
LRRAPGGRIGSGERAAARRRAWWLSAALAAAAAVLIIRPPVPGDVYAPCPWRTLTGTWCPGCGSLRGLGAVLQGDLSVLPRSNAMAAVFLPFLAWWYASLLSRAVFGYRLPSVVPGPRWVLALGALIIVWGVVRNLVPALAPA